MEHALLESTLSITRKQTLKQLERQLENQPPILLSLHFSKGKLTCRLCTCHSAPFPDLLVTQCEQPFPRSPLSLINLAANFCKHGKCDKSSKLCSHHRSQTILYKYMSNMPFLRGNAKPLVFGARSAWKGRHFIFVPRWYWGFGLDWHDLQTSSKHVIISGTPGNSYSSKFRNKSPREKKKHRRFNWVSTFFV